jgi:hypothetical protein
MRGYIPLDGVGKSRGCVYMHSACVDQMIGTLVEATAASNACSLKLCTCACHPFLQPIFWYKLCRWTQPLHTVLKQHPVPAVSS